MHAHHQAYLTGVYSIISNRMVRLATHHPMSQRDFRNLLLCLGPAYALVWA